MKKYLLAMTYVLLPLTTLAKATDYESLTGLSQQVKNYVASALQQADPKADFEVQVHPIDKRLKLKKCLANKLRIYNPYKRPLEQSSTIAVKCRAPVNWSIFVPVEIKTFKNIVVSKRYISKNQLIKASDVKVARKSIERVRHGYFSEPKLIIGKLARRSILKNRIIRPSNLKLAKLIAKGEMINITAASDVIKVSVKGVALTSGTLGQIIAVKNLTSNKVIEAKVIAKKEVLINL